jgi:hypothetical protein
LREGDQNTKYFHRKASDRAKKNKILRQRRDMMDLLPLKKKRFFLEPTSSLMSSTQKILK